MDLSGVMLINLSDEGVSLIFDGGMASYYSNGQLEGCIGDRSRIPSHISVADNRSNSQNSNQPNHQPKALTNL
ncbi:MULTISPECIES: hypothetical protein [Providencia]|uniref:hypothetical protein n=1 Tax=Providencia TaxID=586 RepID=UPI0015EB2C79|nr:MULTISPECIES: hypothetical protein [Providencia]MDL9981746.1 hypothetical protein [Providencia rettgeri]QLQ96023.1 hypothetical protein H0910_10210 [Providencia alcalifaciens]